jgi:hypothetical protein
MTLPNAAGDYRWYYAWFPLNRTSDGVTGDQPRTFGISPYTSTGGIQIGTASGYFWGSEEPTNANHESEFGAARSRWSGTIRLRNVLFPPVNAQDLLQGGVNNTLYQIDGLRPDWANNQTILDVHSIDFNS